MKKNIQFYTLLFGIGAFGYGLLEILWRGYTHPSMALAGGIVLCFTAVIEKRLKPLKLLYRCIACGLFITLTELIFGFIFNLWLGEAVWDYSGLPINYRGQICLLYGALWFMLSVPLLFLTELIRMTVYGKKPGKPTRLPQKASYKTS